MHQCSRLGANFDAYTRTHECEGCIDKCKAAATVLKYAQYRQGTVIGCMQTSLQNQLAQDAVSVCAASAMHNCNASTQLQTSY